MLMDSLSAKGGVLQVKETGGSLDISHAFRGNGLQPDKNFSAGQYPVKLPDKFVEMVLYYAVKVNELAVDVVEDFALGRLRP